MNEVYVARKNLNELFSSMANIVNMKMRGFLSDFYVHDTQSLYETHSCTNKDTPNKFIWVVRELGTHLVNNAELVPVFNNWRQASSEVYIIIKSDYYYYLFRVDDMRSDTDVVNLFNAIDKKVVEYMDNQSEVFKLDLDWVMRRR